MIRMEKMIGEHMPIFNKKSEAGKTSDKIEA